MKNKYPVLQINKRKILYNTLIIKKMCEKNNIEITPVIKGFNSIADLVKIFSKINFEYIGDARLDKIVQLKKQNFNDCFMLLRLPMISEIEELLEYVEISFNSEINTLKIINQRCKQYKKKHKVILMYDLGDLREGVFNENDFIDFVIYTEKNLDNIIIEGIGTNLGCYGAIAPSFHNMNELINIVQKIETIIKRKIKLISGGATTSLSLILDNKMPKRINHLRIGEGILLSRDLQDLWGYNMNYLYKDSFVLKAEIIEIKNKPSYPIGKIMVDAFGNKPEFKNKGIRKRALLAVGKKDFVFYDQLIPKYTDIEIVGATSDYLIVDITQNKSNFKIGDIIEFEMFYGPMLHLCSSDSINKLII